MLTKIPVSMLVAPGGVENATLLAQKGKVSADTSDSTTPISELTDETYFDETSGVLVLKFANGSVLNVAGFVTASSVPKGEDGERGERGDSGPDGKNGKDGAKGEQGCAGDVGEKGETGDEGPQGRPGDAGRMGDQGPQGEKGDRGDKGETGDMGPTGPKGERGDDGPTGPTGPTGPVGRVNIIVSAVDPGGAASAGSIWVNPNIGQELSWP